jgi:hypothetical protein
MTYVRAMIPRGSVLRKLPVIIEAQQRLRLESLVFSIDLLTLAFASLRDLAARLGSNVVDLSDTERMAMFLHAWTMVDQVHVIRQLLRDLSDGEMGKTLGKFYSDFEGAHHLRNKMDHLRMNIQNLATRKGMRAPLFGAISYLVVEPHQVTQHEAKCSINGATAITIMAGSVPDGKSLFPIAVAPRQIPVSAFKLFAFDREIDLEDAFIQLQVVMTKLGEMLAAQLTEHVDAISKTSEATIEQLMAALPMSGGMIIAATIQYGDETTTTEPKGSLTTHAADDDQP